jgi:DNA-binding NarL/FixJ family response regulator
MSDKLTHREREILLFLAQGKHNKQIAKDLGISEATVETHLCSIYRKLDVQTRVEATLYALRAGLLTDV